MGMNEKINIFIPNYIEEIINKDAKLFEIFKKDKKTINRNKFLTLLINGYYTVFINEYLTTKEKIKLSFKDSGISESEKNDLIYNLTTSFYFPPVEKKKGKKLSRISLKPTKDNINALIALEEYFNEYSTSNYLSCIIQRYSNLPLYERERIIFSSKYSIIKNACTNKNTFSFRTIWNNKRRIIFPYKIVVSDEENFNYLICSEMNEFGKEITRSFRLNRITDISISNTKFYQSDEIVRKMEKMIYLSPQYEINEEYHSIIKLTDYGVILLNRIYQGRPNHGNLTYQNGEAFFHYDGSLEQLFFYFRKFGANACVIEPIELKNKFKEYYKSGSDLYLSNSKEENYE